MLNEWDYKELFSTIDGTYIDKFIKDFRKKFGSDELAEYVFCNGYCYHFACILAHMFRGSIMYNPIDNHFGFGDTETDFVWDITGKIGSIWDPQWKTWSNYQVKEPIESQRIIEQCIYKVYNNEDF